MALAQVVKEIANDPDSLKALNAAFQHVEEIPFVGMHEPLYKTFRVQGQGVPRSDKYVRIIFERTIRGVARIASWEPADEYGL